MLNENELVIVINRELRILPLIPQMRDSVRIISRPPFGIQGNVVKLRVMWPNDKPEGLEF